MKIVGKTGMNELLQTPLKELDFQFPLGIFPKLDYFSNLKQHMIN